MLLQSDPENEFRSLLIGRVHGYLRGTRTDHQAGPQRERDAGINWWIGRSFARSVGDQGYVAIHTSALHGRLTVSLRVGLAMNQVIVLQCDT